jgi:hypothetical protein
MLNVASRMPSCGSSGLSLWLRELSHGKQHGRVSARGPSPGGPSLEAVRCGVVWQCDRVGTAHQTARKFITTAHSACLHLKFVNRMGLAGPRDCKVRCWAVAVLYETLTRTARVMGWNGR